MLGRPKLRLRDDLRLWLIYCSNLQPYVWWVSSCDPGQRGLCSPTQPAESGCGDCWHGNGHRHALYVWPKLNESGKCERCACVFLAMSQIMLDYCSVEQGTTVVKSLGVGGGGEVGGRGYACWVYFLHYNDSALEKLAFSKLVLSKK